MELLSLQFSIIRFLAVFLLLTAVGVGSYQYQILTECRYNSPSLEGTEFIDRYIFNKLEFLRYNSTLNKFIGYTELGVKNAERLNNDPSELAGEKSNLDGYCKHNAKLYYDLILGNSGTGQALTASTFFGSAITPSDEIIYLRY
ncbi:H-2 class II histocompatibility antigen, A beta chain-like [Polypterus senegalus]|uniref:H-2 class II histocompatibility antigen, A beta chain-like n=1 Tax=Polypterus senegalus TaxID=55291 RepID=UPI00196458E3|nr:H-2 class II histocompatibility antigen, A beta chain-like [Polypterus senegalus]